jgi:Tol biopolymer transport system component
MRALLLLAVVLVSSLAVGAAQGVTPGKNGVIYFENFNDSTETSDIYSINPDGTGLKAVTTSDSADETGPASSPDGKQIAFLSNEGGDVFHLHLMNSDGSGEHALATGGDGAGSPAWSPNGTQIAFSRCVAIDPDTGDCTNAQIAVIGAAGTGLKLLTRSVSPNVVDSRPAWAPNGKSIVFQRLNDEGIVSLWTVGVATTTVKRILDDGSDMDRSPSFEPNGERVVFASDVGNHEAIWFVNANGHGKKRLFQESPDPDDPTLGGGTENPAVSPDGKQIVYTAAGDLWISAINGSNRKQLTQGGGDEADWAHG